MHVYLPIAEMSVNLWFILGLGGVTGILSGMFGVGGGFLLTPFLIFIGVPPSVSVSTVANQIIASSISGLQAHVRRGNVDFKMGTYLLIGGLVGSTLGVLLFRWLKDSGYIDITISIVYVTFLTGIGSTMAFESVRAIMKITKRSKAKDTVPLAQRLPFRTEFPKSKLNISIIMPIAVGLFVGMMVSLMGIGGGFFLIPAMIYLLGMPTSVVIGTSLFQIIFITANVTLLHAMTTRTVDIMLAFLLLCGSAIGAQFGTKIGAKIPAEYLRALLAALVLSVAMKLGFSLFTAPSDIFSVSVLDD